MMPGFLNEYAIMVKGLALTPGGRDSRRWTFDFGLWTLILLVPLSVVAQSAHGNASAAITTRQLNSEITDFLTKEVAAHLDDIRSLDPPQSKVVGAGSTGEYTWGTFMRALGAYAELSGNRSLGQKDLAREVAQIGLLEQRLGGTRFSQLYAALALRHFGKDLDTNPVWQSLNESERAQWRKLLDVSAFYNPKTQEVINLPENYLGVAARIASITYQLGLMNDRALLDGVITRAARPFANGGLYADDAPPTGRFDRYSNEYARFVWDAAEAAGRKDILESLKPTMKAQMRLWWDLILPDGYGYAWGRSLGAISYMDTMEIVSFLARNAEFRPAPIEQLLSAYYQAWHWLRQDYRPEAHLLSVFAFGRGNFAYINREREWQQTAGFFGKVALSQQMLANALTRDNVTNFPPEIVRPDVARFEFFRKGDRTAGVWLVRRGSLFFTLPITTGTKPGVADYLPAPHGLSGVAAPVEQLYPMLVPFIKLADGKTLVAADGADDIIPSSDGLSLKARWNRWAVLGTRSGQFVEPKITSEVTWRVSGNALIRDEVLTASAPITVERWWLAVPTTATRHVDKGKGVHQFPIAEGELQVSATSSLPMNTILEATGNSSLGKGARGAIPLHLIYESKDVRLRPGNSARIHLVLTISNAMERGH
jgi:hypothetical protein